VAVSTTIAKKEKKEEKNNIDYSNGVEKRDGFKDRYQECLYIVNDSNTSL